MMLRRTNGEISGSVDLAFQWVTFAGANLGLGTYTGRVNLAPTWINLPGDPPNNLISDVKQK